MIKIDLITGFLGSGKTTFIKKYASYLLKKGMNIGILENDFGAVNVDMMLLQDLMGDNCELEMVSGVVEGNYYDKAGMEALANVPSREELLGKLLGSIQSPIANLARVLNQIAESKGGAAEA